MNHSEAKLAKIRALLAKAEDDAATPAEAATYRAKAYELMAAYGIEEAMTADAKPTTDTAGDRIVNLDNPWTMEKAHLYNAIVEAMGCDLVLTDRTDGKPGRSIHLFGFASDLERLDMLATSLMVQMFRELARTPVPTGTAPRAWRRSWMLGFIDVVGQRVTEAQRRAAEQHTPSAGRSVSLVLADRAAIVERAKREAYPKTRSGRARTRATGFGQGKAAGRRADIGQTRVNGAGRAAIGR